MSAVHRLAPNDLAALRKGRAIAFLLDHRSAELPGFTLTVIAHLDTEKFCGVLVDDAHPDADLVDLDLPEPFVAIDDSVRLESDDAAAVHRLWQRWNGGGRDLYLNLFGMLALARSVVSLSDLLSSLDASPNPDPETADATPSPEAPQRPRRKAKKTSSRKGGNRS